ncbi:LamG-like jellyroll fold domain-containing protein [Priestia aryabhattai]
MLISSYIHYLKTNYRYNKMLEELQKQYNSGDRITGASDDAAGLSLSERLKSQANGYIKGIENLKDAKAATELVSNTYKAVSDTLQNMKKLVVTYQDAATTTTEKDSIQKQLILLQGDIQRQLTNMKYENNTVTTAPTSGKLSLSSYGDSIIVEDNSSIKMSSSSITLEAKVNLTKYAPNTSVDDRSLVLGKYGNYYLTINSTGNVGIYKYGTSSSGYRESVGKVGLGQDTTISGVFDGNIAKIYINGKLDSTFTLPGSGYEDRDANLTIGYENSPKYKRQFDGTIDNIRIYDRALSDSEVSGNYRGSVTRNNLVGEWLFDDGNLNSTVYDTSGNNNFGSFTGTAKVITSSDPNMKFSTGTGSLEIGFATLTLSKLGIADFSQIQPNTLDKLNQAMNLLSSERIKADSFINSINSRIQTNTDLATSFQTGVDNIRLADTNEISSQITKIQMQQSTTSELLETIHKYNKANMNLMLAGVDLINH